MRLCFSGIESSIEISSQAVSTLEIHNRVLFSRICESLLTEEGEDAVEPFSLWDDNGDELKARNHFLFIGNPIQLPWDDRSLQTAILNRMEGLLYENVECRREAEETFHTLNTKFSSLALQLYSDYSFGVDWDPKRYLKAFGFGVDIASNETLLDKIIMFLMTVKDASLGKVIVFVNLKLFLSIEELKRLFEHIFFLRLSVLLVENAPSVDALGFERKYTIDQDFIEFLSNGQSGLNVPLQEGICSNGFGAVSS